MFFVRGSLSRSFDSNLEPLSDSTRTVLAAKIVAWTMRENHFQPKEMRQLQLTNLAHDKTAESMTDEEYGHVAILQRVSSNAPE